MIALFINNSQETTVAATILLGCVMYHVCWSKESSSSADLMIPSTHSVEEKVFSKARPEQVFGIKVYVEGSARVRL